jgi:hypothetical protein
VDRLFLNFPISRLHFLMSHMQPTPRIRQLREPLPFIRWNYPRFVCRIV